MVTLRIGLVTSLALTGCSYMPAAQEKARAEQILSSAPDVMQVYVSCEGSLLASDALCATVTMKDGSHLTFERVGFNSFGSTAVNVVLAASAGLEPRIASCAGTGSPNMHREGPVGHHFHPTLVDLREAVARYREVLEEVEFWPQCPQFYDVRDKRGADYRYCARKKGASDEPPRPMACP